jgi:glycosyltransferase involved in cell wall biosynthesis
MKIAIMAAWNTTSGVCMHSEPIGKSFVKKGHQVVVFTYTKDDYHGEGITGEDEEYVIRCLGTRPHTNSLDPRPFIENDYDVLLVEDLGMLPVDKLADIMPIIKRKAKVVHVVHENRPCEHPWFYKIEWDKVSYFDSRQDFLLKAYPDAVHIPFPCYRVREGNREEARKKLDLPLDKKIVYSFAHRGYTQYYQDLPRELKDSTILLKVIPQDRREMLEESSDREWIIIRREEVITTEKFDDYLFASDAVILHKYQSREHAVVSTTALQALGKGCPIFVPKDSDFFHELDDEIIHYADPADLDKKLIEILTDVDRQNAIRDKAEAFIENRSPGKIADEFIKLFKELK